jgi:hypothetical protein
MVTVDSVSISSQREGRKDVECFALLACRSPAGGGFFYRSPVNHLACRSQFYYEHVNIWPKSPGNGIESELEFLEALASKLEDGNEAKCKSVYTR